MLVEKISFEKEVLQRLKQKLKLVEVRFDEYNQRVLRFQEQLEQANEENKYFN